MKYGWKPDKPDYRDYLLKLPPVQTSNVDLRKTCPAIYDQGNLGSCTGNAIAFLLHFDELLEKTGHNQIPSRLFIYYNERLMEGTANYDSGAEIRDGLKSVAKQGACPESMWPYIISRFTLRPVVKCYQEATKHIAMQYFRLDNTKKNDLISCLKAGFPFVFGISVYQNFVSKSSINTGVISMPSGRLLGGHALAAVGYIQSTDQIIFRNSWGTSWGDKGYGYIPAAYLTNTNLADDFWTIRRVS